MSITASLLVEKVKLAGVVGAGGAGFPTHIKYQGQADHVIINGAECEPLLWADKEIMRLRAAQVISALRSVMEAKGAKQGVIVIKRKHQDIVDTMQKACSRFQVNLELIDDYYPAGDEHVLIHEVTGEPLPAGVIPAHRKIIVNNVETMLNVNNALQGEPVTEKWVTVTGAVARPSTFIVPLGTPIKLLIDAAGGVTETGYTVISGGPMMGSIINPESPVTKIIKGILVFPSRLPVSVRCNTSLADILRLSKKFCVQCSYCTQMCPRYLLGHPLEPHRIMRAFAYSSDLTPAVFRLAHLCCECGVCSVIACPMGISPMHVNKWLKKELSQRGLRYEKGNDQGRPRADRGMRLISSKNVLRRLGIGSYDHYAGYRKFDNSKVQEVRLPLKQHVGNPAVPKVKTGDQVKKGDLIAEVVEGIGASLHASISGVVKVITSDMIVIRAEKHSAARGV